MGNTIAAVGKIRSYQINNSILNLFPLIVAFVLFKINFPVYTLYLVFIGYAICDGILTLYFTKEVCGLSISLYLKEVIFPSLLISILVVGFSSIPFFMLHEGFLRLILVGVTSTISLLISVWAIGLSFDEKRHLLLILKVIKNKMTSKL